jgi:hypothetical protein
LPIDVIFVIEMLVRPEFLKQRSGKVVMPDGKLILVRELQLLKQYSPNDVSPDGKVILASELQLEKQL